MLKVQGEIAQATDETCLAHRDEATEKAGNALLRERAPNLAAAKKERTCRIRVPRRVSRTRKIPLAGIQMRVLKFSFRPLNLERPLETGFACVRVL